MRLNQLSCTYSTTKFVQPDACLPSRRAGLLPLTKTATHCITYFPWSPRLKLRHEELSTQVWLLKPVNRPPSHVLTAGIVTSITVHSSFTCTGCASALYKSPSRRLSSVDSRGRIILCISLSGLFVRAGFSAKHDNPSRFSWRARLQQMCIGRYRFQVSPAGMVVPNKEHLPDLAPNLTRPERSFDTQHDMLYVRLNSKSCRQAEIIGATVMDDRLECGQATAVS